MRVVSWNMAYWKPARFKTVANRQRQWALLAALAPDIALLQECRPGDLETLAPRWMAGEFSIVGDIPVGWTGCSAVIARNGLGLRSADRSVMPPDERRWLDYFQGYVATASVSLDGDAVVVTSVHAVAKEVDDDLITEGDHTMTRRTTLAKAWHNDLCASALRGLVADGPFVVGGDWNTARLFDDFYGDQWGTSSTEFFQVLRSWGWQESLRKFHLQEIQTYLDPMSRPYELDHLFTSGGLHELLQSCEALGGPLVSELSDHAPIVADFEEVAPS